jgi:hypothetical protein
MNHIEYFEGKFNFPEAGHVGVESDWLDFGDLKVPQGKLWIGDASVPTAEEGCIVNVPAGVYRVDLKGMDFNGARVPSRVRVVKKGAKFAVGPKQGEAITDTAQVGICDIAEMDAVVTKKNMKEFESDLQAQISESPMSICQFVYGKSRFHMAFVPSGFSDGAYDVFALLSGGKIVGIETEFLRPGYKME